MNNFKIITSTTREGRKGILVAEWLRELMTAEEKHKVELLDLAEINLPFMDEPNHPMMRQYQHEHTKKWSSTIESADGYIIVLAEYNFSFPAPIKNALDYLYHEWRYKPIGFVSYGGMSGGIRSAQMLKQVVTTLSMVPLVESVAIPSFGKYITEGKFTPEEIVVKSTKTMVTELVSWSEILKTKRQKG